MVKERNVRSGLKIFNIGSARHVMTAGTTKKP